MLYMASYLMFKHRVYWKYLYNKYIFNFIDHLHCYSCEWLCRSQCTVLPQAYNAVKTALHSSDVDEVLFEWPNSTCRCWFSSVKFNASSMWRGAKLFVLGPRLYCIFAKPISEICRRHNFSHHSYADDIQVYLVIKPLDNWKIYPDVSVLEWAQLCSN